MGHLVNVSFAETSADRLISQFILDPIDANGFLSARIWLTLPSSLLHNPEGDRRFVRFASGAEGSIYPASNRSPKASLVANGNAMTEQP
ncbi:hypothetical protein Rcae01_00849 [Novipirellula caenicola]|uniref:Uncharacterized protein n=1 Tax=Novipirellula caenicola TaxID=1536901 RepID=A0ABP9VJN5_9BACT